MATHTITVAPSGADYTTLDAALTHGEADLVATTTNVQINISGDWSSAADTTAATVHNYTTSATYDIKITCTDAHAGVWNDAKYRLECSNVYALHNLEEYVTISGLQISLSVSSALTYGIYVSTGTTSNVTIKKCILRCTSASGAYDIIGISSGGGVVNIWNNVVYDFVNGTRTCYGINVASATSGTLYNNTIHGCYAGLRGPVIAINNLVSSIGSTSIAYVGTFSDGTDYNVTDANDDIGKGTHNHQTQTFVFVDHDGKNFNLAESDTGARGEGTNHGAFTDDIKGTTRSAWDCGAFEYVASGLTLVSPTSGQTDVGVFLPLRLDWSDLSGAVSYHLQVSVNSDFSSPVIDTTTSNSYYETEDLLPGTKYYWRVRALV